MGLSEFEEMKPIIENAALGSYLILPLRFSENTLDINWIQKNPAHQGDQCPGGMGQA